MDIIIKNAKLRNGSKIVDIGISNGKIIKIANNINAEATKIIDAKEKLVTESFANPHLHLCKVYTLTQMDNSALKSYHGEDMGAAMTAIELAAKIKEKYDEKWIIENVRKALKLAVKYGNFHIRAFADVDSKAKLEGVKALLKAKEEFKNVINLQVVAFPQDGIIREPGTEELLEESMAMGADVVGGIPWIEYTEKDEQKHIDIAFKLAKKYNADISMLVDDAGDAGLRSLEKLAVSTVENNWTGRVLAHHARAMSMYSEPYLRKLIALLKRAKIGIVTDPHTGPLHAKVKELLREKSLVVFAQDDIIDAYYPFGRNNMLEVAFLNVHLLWMTSFQEMEKIYDMITVDPAYAMNVKNFGLQVGNDAHLVVLDGENVHEALRFHHAPLYTISHGKLVS